MKQGQLNQKMEIVLDAGLETQLLANQLVSEVRKSPGHFSFTLTDLGVIQFAKAMHLALLDESISSMQKDSESLSFPDNDNDLITKKEVMVGLRVSHTTLWKWEKSGYLTPIKVGKRVYYRREDINALTKKGG